MLLTHFFFDLAFVFSVEIVVTQNIKDSYFLLGGDDKHFL